MMKKHLLIWMLIGSTIVNASKKDVIHAPLDIISLDDITPEERKQIAEFEAEINRHKRSGSGDILGTLKNAIGQSIKKKIGQVAKASAAASGAFSRSSSGGKHEGGYVYEHPHEYDYHHDIPESYDHKSFDWWSLKKSILNTLLQAVKAIKGGVIAVKGQLIKGGGKLISAKGQFISSKGEQITTLGKKLATSAVLVPHPGHPTSDHSGHEESHSGYHYSAPSAPAEYYHGAPTGSGSYHHNPGEIYEAGHDHSYVPNQHGGLLILKKIQSGNDESKVPSFKPMEPRSPSLATIVGKFFGASSSLDPHKPEPFDYTSVGQSSYELPKSTHQEATKDQYVSPAAADYVKAGSSHSDSPFEETPNYVNQNFEDFATSDSKDAPQTVEFPSKLKQLKNPVKTQLVKEVSGNTQTNSLELLPPKIDYNSQKLEFGENPLPNNNVVALLQKPESNLLPQSQSFNSGSVSNGYSLLNGQLGVAQNFSTFPNSYLSEKPIEPISLGEYTQQYGSSPFLDQNSFTNQYTGVQSLQYQTPNVLSNPTLTGQSLGASNVVESNLHGQGSLGFGGSFVSSLGDQFLGEPPLGQPNFDGSTGLGNQGYSDLSSFQNYIDPVSSPSRYLQTPKKTYSLSMSIPGSQPPKSLDSYKDPRISHYKKRKSHLSKRQPTYGSVHKPNSPNYDLDQDGITMNSSRNSLDKDAQVENNHGGTIQDKLTTNGISEDIKDLDFL